MGLGKETQRQIVLKYRQRLKALLCEHEVTAPDAAHMILLGDLIRIVDEQVQQHKQDTTL